MMLIDNDVSVMAINDDDDSIVGKYWCRSDDAMTVTNISSVVGIISGNDKWW